MEYVIISGLVLYHRVEGHIVYKNVVLMKTHRYEATGECIIIQGERLTKDGPRQSYDQYPISDIARLSAEFVPKKVQRDI